LPNGRTLQHPKWHVTLKLFFKRTNDESSEPNPTQKQIDAYMRKNRKYRDYVFNIYEEASYVSKNANILPKKIKYESGGRLSFEIPKLPMFFTAQKVKDYILYNDFEDGMFEAMPGNGPVWPSKYEKEDRYFTSEHTYKYFKYFPELGVIDCRKKSSIVVKKAY